jgi:transcriptional regulator with XRE-family HTH domain
MNLPEALDAALRGRYRVTEVKSPASTRRGLTARMAQMEKAFTRPGDRKGAAGRRAAEAAGVSLRTWQRWRSGKQSPAARTVAKLQAAYDNLVRLPRLRKQLRKQGVPNAVTVTAVIKWSTSTGTQYNRANDGHRTTTLIGMGPAMRAVVRAWATEGPEAAAEALERGTAATYSVPDDDDGSPGIEFEGDEVEIEL